MTIERPALRYHGGKFRLAPFVLSFFPKHAMYIEPFGGGASILMLKDQCRAEIYNDLDSQVVNYFRVLQDPFKSAALQARLRLTPYAREVFHSAYEEPKDDQDAAYKLVIKSFMGHGSDSATRGCRSGFRCKRPDGRALPSVDFMGWVEHMPQLTQRLRHVVIENLDALDLIKRSDAPGHLFYVDPPYVHSTRTALEGRSSHGYRHEMTDEDHRALAALLHDVKGMVILSGYSSGLYTELYADWKMVSQEHYADGGVLRTEVLWLNPACEQALELELSQPSLFAMEA